MSASDSPLTLSPSTGAGEIDLGLQLPADFDLQPLVPHDSLLRLHPNWFVSGFQEQDGAFTVTLKDYVTEDEFPLSGSFVFNGRKDELLCITLTGSIEVEIRFLRRDNRLHVEIHSASGELDADDPLLLWIRAIREYMRLYLKQTPATLFFRLVMNRMVLQMNPSQRKICLMLARFTFVEILLILFIVIGYVIFVL